MSETILISYAPATGVEIWRGDTGDVGAAVSRARRAWPAWAAQPVAHRIEVARRFANEVRADAETRSPCAGTADQDRISGRWH